MKKMKKMKKKVSPNKKNAKGKKYKNKMHKVLHEYKEGELHSGSKKGPLVKSRRQALAIAMNEARKGA